jgi:manganese oxidase
MNFHARRTTPSYTPSGAPANFITNGRPAVAGAPFADPCVDDAGNAAGVARIYKAANFQLDLKLNKAGWHFPQSRILALWEDVKPTQAGTKPPEPLFFRANTNDCITFYHTNLVPGHYEQDDFQIRTPTDVMGQHIHLVKFDVLASDGAGNGWNYEDGTFSPDEVIERINAINTAGGLLNGKAKTKLTARAHPFFGIPGAQTTIQRWFADQTLNNAGKDRTLNTVFTHDHYGPSTHQQVGTYASLVVEPAGSKWRDPETGTFFGSRADGGPTSWRADILTANTADSYREFLLEFTDFQLAYTADNKPVNPPGRVEVGLPFLLAPPKQCPGGVPAPCPEAISADDPGTMSVNYRNEPVALRVRDPLTNTQAAGDAGDLSQVFSSRITRKDPALNTQPTFYPPLTKGVQPGDPFTPLMRVYDNDRVQIRVVVGGQEEGHNFSLHGLKWLFEPSEKNSGWRNSQMMGISEHFEFIAPVVAPKSQRGAFSDYLYQPGASVDNLWNGTWGILRSYSTAQSNPTNNLLPLPNNVAGGPDIANPGAFSGVCPTTAPTRNFDVTAVSAANALPNGTLVYNSRPAQGGQLHDPTAILYVRTADLDPATFKLKPSVPIEPLILRANAGDCINLTLRNRVRTPLPDLDGFNTLPMIVNHFNANQVKPSPLVGLHPQLLAYDVTRSDGANVGFNNAQLVNPTTATTGTSQTYKWYAGDLSLDTRNNLVATPIEFGATNLISSDRIKHSNKGAVGALIIEPQGASWIEDANSRASATVTAAAGTFREFVTIFQNDLNLRFGTGAPVPNLAETEDSEDSGQKAFNYRTEPMWKRLGFAPDAPLTTTRKINFTNALSNALVGGDPVTPVFTAKAGTPIRFRVLHPAGHARNNVFAIHGHIWEQEPYINHSRSLGSNPLSEWKGSTFGIGPSSHFDVLLKNGAGGRFLIPGDYLYHTLQSFQFDGGLWGIFRVTP